MSSVTLKGRRIAAANTKWKVHLDHLVDERGNEVEDYLSLAPSESRPNQVTGVAVLPVLDDGFLLIRSYRHALGTELWEVPRGFCDTGETAAQAALRELTEETGLVCAPADLVMLGHYAPEASTIGGRGALFAATRCVGPPRQATDELGLGRLEFVTRPRMEALIATGEIEDAGTLIVYYRFRALGP
jgi:ADP-ribose pyrophosphatase